MNPVLTIVCTAMQLYVYVLLGRVVLSWFPLAPGGAMASIHSALYTVTEPVLGPLRRVIPPLGMFDLSVIIAIIGLQLIRASICSPTAGFL